MALQAGLWGLVGGLALVLGAALGYAVRVPPKLIGAIMAFGAGVLISACAFELVDEAHRSAGLVPTVVGFLAGAIAYVGANAVLARRGARHRKRSGGQQPSESEAGGSGAAIAVGALLDGVPESIVIGISLLAGGAVSAATVAAVFISNIPEGLSSAAGMRKAGRGPRYVFGVWGAIAVTSGLAALFGYAVLGKASVEVVGATTGVAAGAILAMIVDTMIPEAVEEDHLLTGLLAAVGFLVAFGIGAGPR